MTEIIDQITDSLRERTKGYIGTPLEISYIHDQLVLNPDKALQYVSFTENRDESRLALDTKVRWGYYSSDRKTDYRHVHPYQTFDLNPNIVSVLFVALDTGGTFYGNYVETEGGRVAIDLHYQPIDENLLTDVVGNIIPPEEKYKRMENYREMLRGIHYLKGIFTQHNNLPIVDDIIGVTSREMALFLQKKYPETVIEEVMPDGETVEYSIRLPVSAVV